MMTVFIAFVGHSHLRDHLYYIFSMRTFWSCEYTTKL